MAATGYMHRKGAERVAIVGASLGGWAAAEAVAAFGLGGVDRLVLIAAPPIDHPKRLTGSKLFIVSRGDTTGTGRSRLDQLRRQYEEAPDPKEMLVVEGKALAQLLFQESVGDRVMKEKAQVLVHAPTRARSILKQILIIVHAVSLEYIPTANTAVVWGSRAVGYGASLSPPASRP